MKSSQTSPRRSVRHRGQWSDTGPGRTAFGNCSPQHSLTDPAAGRKGKRPWETDPAPELEEWTRRRGLNAENGHGNSMAGEKDYPQKKRRLEEPPSTPPPVSVPLPVDTPPLKKHFIKHVPRIVTPSPPQDAHPQSPTTDTQGIISPITSHFKSINTAVEKVHLEVVSLRKEIRGLMSNIFALQSIPSDPSLQLEHHDSVDFPDSDPTSLVIEPLGTKPHPTTTTTNTTA